MLFAQFSYEGSYVYAFSSTKNFYIFSKQNAKLVSLLLIPTAKAEINGLLVAGLGAKNNKEESVVLYGFEEMFKIVSI